MHGCNHEYYCSFVPLTTEHFYELHGTDFIPPRTKQKTYYASRKGLRRKIWLIIKKNIFSGINLEVYGNSTSLFNTALQLYFTYYLTIIQILHAEGFAGFPFYFFMWI